MNALKTALLMTILTLLLVFAGNALGGRSGMVIAFVMAAVMNFGAYWFSDRMALSMYGAREVSETEAPELLSMVRELSARGGLPMPRVYIVEIHREFGEVGNGVFQSVREWAAGGPRVSLSSMICMCRHTTAALSRARLLLAAMVRLSSGGAFVRSEMGADLLEQRSEANPEGSKPLAGG